MRCEMCLWIDRWSCTVTRFHFLFAFSFSFLLNLSIFTLKLIIFILSYVCASCCKLFFPLYFINIFYLSISSHFCAAFGFTPFAHAERNRRKKNTNQQSYSRGTNKMARQFKINHFNVRWPCAQAYLHHFIFSFKKKYNK